jgi:hypothetical protein
MTLPLLMTPGQLREAQSPVRMVTTVEADGVCYQVFSGLFPIWAKFVPFKRRAAYRPGGPMFRAAARAQEAFAAECVDLLKLGEAIKTRFEQGR